MLRNLNPNQLAMFMPAHQIAAGDLGDAPEPDQRGFVMKQKRRELDERWADRDMKVTTRRQAFEEGGIKTPLEIDHYGDYSQLGDGHHRLAWAMQKDRNMELPVKHFGYGH